MANACSQLLKNLDKIHTTELCEIRIKKNLELSTDVIKYCIDCIKQAIRIERKGKNFYVYTAHSIITINAQSYTVITAHRVV